ANCFRACPLVVEPMRVLKPAAGIMANPRIMSGDLSDFAAEGIRHAAKDHLPRSGLQDRGHGDFHIARDHAPGMVHHHHGAVIEVGDPLITAPWWWWTMPGA